MRLIHNIYSFIISTMITFSTSVTCTQNWLMTHCNSNLCPHVTCSEVLNLGQRAFLFYWINAHYYPGISIWARLFGLVHN